MNTFLKHLVVFRSRYAFAFAAALLVFLCVSQPARAASPVHLFLVPDSSQVVVGEVTRSDLWIDTGDNTINAADLSLRFDPTLVQLDGAERTPSIFNLWVKEPEVSVPDAEVHFISGSTTAFKGQGVIGQIYWTATKVGHVSVTLLDGSAVLLADGQGTRATIDIRPTTYQVTSAVGTPEVSSDSHPDQNAWYQDTIVRLSWPTTTGTDYSYLVTRSPSDEPDDKPDQPIGHITLSALGDGIYYFKIRQRPAGGTWSATATRQFKIDATPPDPFVVTVSRDARLFNGKPFASFVATDRASGVVAYEVQEGNQPPQRITAPPYVLQYGDRDLRVTAIDRAGNERTVVVKARPTYSLLTIIILLFTAALGLLLAISLQPRRRTKKHHS